MTSTAALTQNSTSMTFFADMDTRFANTDKISGQSPQPSVQQMNHVFHKKLLELHGNPKAAGNLEVTYLDPQAKQNFKEFSIGDWKKEQDGNVLCLHRKPTSAASNNVKSDRPKDRRTVEVPHFGPVPFSRNAKSMDIEDFKGNILCMKTAKQIEARGHNYLPGQTGHPETAFNECKADAIRIAKKFSTPDVVMRLELMTFEGRWQG